jgi:hypothetical protein
MLVLCQGSDHFDGCGLFQYSQERILEQDGKEESCSSGARRVSIFEVILGDMIILEMSKDRQNLKFFSPISNTKYKNKPFCSLTNKTSV